MTRHQLPAEDLLPDGTTIRLRSGHTFTRRHGWACGCGDERWTWPNVVAYAQRHGIVDVEQPAILSA